LSGRTAVGDQECAQTLQARPGPVPVPIVPASHAGLELDAESGPVRAADLIGQLGDPNYIRKANALFHEFAEIGFANQLGYGSPDAGSQGGRPYHKRSSGS
jgi:hypothetical protein